MPRNDFLWVSINDVVYILDIEKGRYAALRGKLASDWIMQFGALRISRVENRKNRSQHSNISLVLKYFIAWNENRNTRRNISQGRFCALFKRAEIVSGTSGNTPVNALPSAMRAFMLIETFFPSADPTHDCLARSFSLFFYLKKLGFRVQHHVGIRVLPFSAHAWVSINNKAIIETDEQIKKWTLISQIG